MTHDTRSPDDIERDIGDERAQMTGTLTDLQNKFSVDTIVSDLGAMIKDQGGDLGRAISGTVGRNPAAIAVIGLGAAWLFLGRDRTTTDAGHRGQSSSRASAAGARRSPGDSDRDRSWYDEAAGRKGGSMPDGRGGGGSGGAVSDAAENLGQSASDLAERLSHGLEDLSDEARSQVMAARRAAHDAAMASRRAIKDGAQKAATALEDQPLVVGGLALAFGAAIGAILPHTRLEDDTMGDSSDRLFDEAQAIFREERDAAMAMAKTAATQIRDDLGDVGSDLGDLVPKGKTATDVVADHAAQAAGRMMGQSRTKPSGSDPAPDRTEP